MTNKKQTDEIAALRAEVEALKAKVDPPKSTFMPMSDAEWRDRMHQLSERRMSHAPQCRPRPERHTRRRLQRHCRQGRDPRPKSGGQVVKPPPGVDLVDKIAVAFDQRERQQAMRPDSERMMEIMVKMMEMQSQTLQAVAAAILRGEKGPKAKPKPRQR
jgi:hypothetical protein